MKRLLTCLLLLALSACGGGALAKTRTAADVGGGIADTLGVALAGPLAAAKDRCADDAECLRPWERAEASVAAVREAMAAMGAAAAAVDLGDENAMGSINCTAAAIARSLRLLKVVGVHPDSQALRTWSRYFGLLETMCVYSTESTLGHGSAEGAEP